MAGLTWADFRGDRLTRVAPGGSVELARIESASLERILIEAGAPRGAQGQVHFAYLNLCDRDWQSRQKRSLVGNEDLPAVLQNPLPRQLFSTRQTSRPLAFGSGE